MRLLARTMLMFAALSTVAATGMVGAVWAVQRTASRDVARTWLVDHATSGRMLWFEATTERLAALADEAAEALDAGNSPHDDPRLAHLVWTAQDDDGATVAGASCAPWTGGDWLTCDGRPVLARAERWAGGVAIAGMPVDDAVAADLTRATGTEVLLADGTGALLGSSLRTAGGVTLVPRLDVSVAVLEPDQPRPVHAFTAEPYGGLYGHHTAPGEVDIASFATRSPLGHTPGVDVVALVPTAQLTEAARRTTALFALVASAIGLLCAIVAGALVRRLLLPVRALVAAATAIGRGDLDARVDYAGHDEFGDLSRAFNDMAASLRKSQREVIQLSRLGGMAEVASGVLHNVGNVLNSANVSTELAAELVSTSRGRRLASIADLLDQHQADLAGFLTADPRGMRVPEFVRAMSESLADERARLASELDAVRSSLEQIRAIVSRQQDYARLGGLRVKADIDAILHDAVALDGAGGRGGVSVRIEADVPPCVIDPNRVLQVVTHLVRNAREAVEASDNPDRRVVVRATNPAPSRLRISVLDSGVGIDPDNRPHLFTHGFTTKEQGCGFGLHAAALAAAEMHGSIEAHSAGVGHGSVFTLEIPLTTAEPARGAA